MCLSEKSDQQNKDQSHINVDAHGFTNGMCSYFVITVVIETILGKK